MKENKVEPYSWYLKNSLKLFLNPPLELMSDVLDDFKDLIWAARDFGIGIISLLILLIIYITFPVSFPFVALCAMRKDIKYQDKINKKVDKLHEAMKPNPKKEK